MLDSNMILGLGIGFGACVGWILRQETTNLGNKISRRKLNTDKHDFKHPKYIRD